MEKGALRIVLCSDGTGNTVVKGRGTNVYKLFEAVKIDYKRIETSSGTRLQGQIAFYDDGVGTGWGLVKVVGGAFGLGLKRNVKDLYSALCRVYSPGDDIYLFGFSRGAYTVRLLAGMIINLGVIKYSKVRSDSERFSRLIDEAYDIYRSRLEVPRGRTEAARETHAARIRAEAAENAAKFRRAHCHSVGTDGRVPIRFIGVFDSVGAVGIPFQSVKKRLNRIYPLEFRVTGLDPLVERACHALAIDDERKVFHPILWDERGEPAGSGRIEQVWFAGAHSNVGGGYPKQGMSLAALDWMMTKAHDAGLGLHFSDTGRKYAQDVQNVHDKLYDSRAGLKMAYRYEPRDIEKLCLENRVTPVLHRSAYQRAFHATEGYAPGNVPSHFLVTGESPDGGALEVETEGRPRIGRSIRARQRAWYLGGAVLSVAAAVVLLAVGVKGYGGLTDLRALVAVLVAGASLGAIVAVNRRHRTFIADESSRFWVTRHKATEEEAAISDKAAEAVSGHVDAVTAVALTPDESRVVTASADTTLRVWNRSTGEQVVIRGHEEQVRAVAATYTLVVSGSEDRTVRMWNLVTGEPLATLTGHANWVQGLAVTADGSRIASASEDGTVRLWDATRRAELRTLRGHREPVYGVAITPDGSRLVSASADRTVKIWDPGTGKELHTLTGHEDFVRAVAITPNGARGVSGSDDGTVRLWDLRSGKEISKLEGHTGYVQTVAITPDGSRAVSGSDDGTVRVWDTATGESRKLTGHIDWVLGVAVTSDGGQVFSASADATLRVWDVAAGEARQTLTGRVFALLGIAIAPDGRLVAASEDQTIKVWSPEDSRLLTGHADYIRAVAVLPGGAHAVSGSDDGTVKLWDLTTGEPVRTFLGHEDYVQAVAVSPDGATIASGSDDATVRLWDVESGKEVHTFVGHANWVTGVAFTPGADRVVSASADGTVRVWDVDSGYAVHTLRGHEGFVRGVAVTADRIVSGSDDHTIKVWRLTSGEEIHTLAGHTGYVRAVAVTPGGTRIVSASDDRTIRAWDMASGAPVRTMEGHAGYVLGVAVDGGGTRVASASADGTLRVWNLQTGEPERTLVADPRGLLVDAG